MTPNHTGYINNTLPVKQSTDDSVFALVSFLTHICLIGVVLHTGAIVLYITDTYAEYKPAILMTLSAVEAIDSFRFALAGWHYLYDNHILMEIVHFLSQLRMFYFETIVLLAIETWIKLKQDIHYDEFKMNRIYSRVIPILFLMTTIASNVFRLRSHFKKSPKLFLICISIFTSVFIILTWMYMLLRIRRTHAPPVKFTVREFGSRRIRVEVDEGNNAAQSHSGTVENCKMEVSLLQRITYRYKWAFSVPALILITHIPFVLIPAVVRYVTVNDLSVVGKELLTMTNLIGHICDAFIQFYCTKRVMRRIRRMFMTW